MRSLIKLLAPDRFEDLMALVALYRPGPLNSGLHTEYAERKHGRRKVTYPHDDLEPILEDTYGVMVYQEQVMQIAVALAGFSMGEADTLRKAMGKKKREVLMPLQGEVHRGARREGLRATSSPTDLFDMIVPFADYGFNASHACAYGLVAYQTAYLKAHHPRRVHGGGAHVGEGRQGPQAVLPVRVPRDGHRGPAAGRERVRAWTSRRRPARRRAIRYGLSAVRNVGEGAVQQIIEARRAKGAFTSFADFCRKVEPSVLTKRVLESPDPGGGVRLAGVRARGLLLRAARTRCPRRSSPSARPRRPGSSRCSAARTTRAARPDRRVRARRARSSTSATLLRYEKEMLGQFVTDHPLLGGQGRRSPRRPPHEIGDLEQLGDGDLVTVGGIIGASPASTRSAASPTRSSGSRASPAASRSWRSRRSTRRCRA